jgi:hypothetical protein
MMILRPLLPRPARRGRRLILLPVAMALALFTSGCDKCGDYFWQNGSKSCHDESQIK